MHLVLKWIGVVWIILFINNIDAYSQKLGLPAKGYSNTFGSAVSAGVFINKEAFFWGLGTDYTRVLKRNWMINISAAFDQEHSRTDGNKSIINTLTPSLALGYAIKTRFALGAGLGKSLFDDDNESNTIKFNKDGGWTIGVVGALTLIQKGKHGFDLVAGIEQGLANSETDITVELGYGFSF
jgi:hypothetical protein